MTTADQAMDRIWTIPNIVSYSRLVFFLPLSIALIASGESGWALVALFFLGTSDGVDGYLARRLGQMSTLGREFDPVSDRATVILVGITLVATGILPWYYVAIIVAVDLTLFLAAILLVGGQPRIPASLLGKARTALLLLALPGLLLADAIQSPGLRTVALVLTALGTLGHVVAGMGYLTQMVQMRARRTRT